MADPVQTAARAISQAKTASQLRKVIGATLNEIHDAHELAKDLPTFSSYSTRQARTELDGVRLPLEALYKRIDGPTEPTPTLAEEARAAARKAWGAIYNVRGAANNFKGWSGADILLQAVAEAPATLLAGTKAVIEGTGQVAGGLVSSLLVGFWPLLLLAVGVFFLQGAARRRGFIP